MNKILVLCTGNICRSPTVEYLLRRELGEGYDVKSAGLYAVVNHGADEMSSKVAAANGLDLSKHRARQVTIDMLKWADLILVMELEQKKELLRRYPWIEGKIFRYGEALKIDVPDPYRRQEEAFRLVWNFIWKLTPGWVSKIKGE